LLSGLPAHPSCLQFHLDQAKSRTQQRLAKGRPKAIDHLAHSLFQLEGLDARQVGGWLATWASVRLWL